MLSFFPRGVLDEILNLIVKLEDKLLKCVEETKLLGVILDKRMNFQSHLEYVERKASTALGSLMIVGKTEKISPVNMIKLYKSIVVPHLEYAASVWQIADCGRLDKIQRKGLALSLGCMSAVSLPSTFAPPDHPREALDVQAGVLPLSLRREELAVRECTKIMAKVDTDPIKKCLLSCQSSCKNSREKR